MTELRASFERRIAAPAAHVYDLIADFDHHHHRFLPPQFRDYRVEAGGYGAGTVVSFKVYAGGPPRPYRTRISEPHPGAVLVESDTLSNLVTTTTVTADEGGCRVRFETVWTAAPGVAGVIERFFAPVVMRRLYADELARLERYAHLQLTPAAVST